MNTIICGTYGFVFGTGMIAVFASLHWSCVIPARWMMKHQWLATYRGIVAIIIPILYLTALVISVRWFVSLGILNAMNWIDRTFQFKDHECVLWFMFCYGAYIMLKTRFMTKALALHDYYFDDDKFYFFSYKRYHPEDRDLPDTEERAPIPLHRKRGR